MISIVNYGMGNLGSIQNMLKKLGEESEITSDINKIEKSNKIILPGVGSFESGIKQLSELNLIECLRYKVVEIKTPILGICLGAQLMTMYGEEGNVNGLGWLDARTIKFDQTKCNGKLVLPNMGWRDIDSVVKHPIFEGLELNSSFYFAHNYHFITNNEDIIGMRTNYCYEFAAALIKDNIIALQFHPEKSHKYGLRLFENFIKNY